MVKELRIYTDGSLTASAYYIPDLNSFHIEPFERGKYTVNEAEYFAIYLAITSPLLPKDMPFELEILSDSELVINQLRGIYQIRSPRMRNWWEKVRRATFEVRCIEHTKFTHIPRTHNLAGILLEDYQKQHK